MTGNEIQQKLEQTLFALARGLGAGVDFMEPIVLMGKLNVHRTPEKDDAYYWRQTPLMKVRRIRNDEGTLWIFLTPEGEEMARYFQDRITR